MNQRTVLCFSLVSMMSMGAGVFAQGESRAAAVATARADADGAEATASVAVSAQQAAEMNSMGDPNAVRAVEETVEAWGERVKKELNIENWGQNGNKFILFQKGNVLKSSTDPEFGKSLEMAFSKTMMDLQSSFVMLRFGRLTIQKSKGFFSDESSNAMEVPLEFSGTAKDAAESIKDKTLQIINKELRLSEAELDAKLREAGVDPESEEISRMPVEKKKVFFSEVFKQTLMKTASGEVSGLVPIQTTVKINDKGRAEIGIVAVVSPMTTQFAKDIANGRSSLIKKMNRATDIADLHPADAAILGTMGTRLFYDNTGAPCIAAYALGSYCPIGTSEYANERRKNLAEKRATAHADAMIAEFAKSFISSRYTEESGESIQQIAKRVMKEDSMTEVEDISEEIMKIHERSKSHAEMNLAGISTAFSKIVTIPSGQHFYTVMRVWRYDALKQVRDFDTQSKERPAGSQGFGSQADPSMNPTGSDSRLMNSLEDF